MLLGYICNEFILNLFLKQSRCTCQEKRFQPRKRFFPRKSLEVVVIVMYLGKTYEKGEY